MKTSGIGSLGPRLAGPVVTLATCWRITRQDGTVYRFTDADRDLSVGGEIYLAKTGYKRTALNAGAAGEPEAMEVEGVIDAASITERDVTAGLWDFAEIRIFLCDWQAPDAGQIKLRRGWLGEVSTNDAGQFHAELRGLSQVLVQRTGEVYSPECRAQLGDTRCTVDLTGFTSTGSIASTPPNNSSFQASGGLQGNDYYVGGVLTFTSGPNTGVKREVLDWTGGIFTLFLPMPYLMATGDAFSVTAGCDKKLATCRDKFNNVLNYRGEPYVPGSDALFNSGIPKAVSSDGSNKK